MSASNSQSPIERLATELLERIFLFTSARDILRLSLVNHAFHDLILASPPIQYEIDLFDLAVQHNPQTKVSLADCRAALGAYSKIREGLDPAEEWERVLDVSPSPMAVAVSGTYGVLCRDSVEFFTLGSVSRGIPKREWEISLEHLDASIFTFYPRANVMAVVEEVGQTWKIHLNTLSDGEPHPTARIKVLSYTFAPISPYHLEISEVSITDSRLAVMRGAYEFGGTQVTVWDWTTGQILLELRKGPYQSAKFVDDYWLALALDPCGFAESPKLMLLNTERTTTDGQTLAETTFHFDPHRNWSLVKIRLYLEQGGHKPSPDDLLAPFYQDASQRILAVGFNGHNSVFVTKIGALLELARERGGTHFEWEQWKAHVAEIQPECYTDLWISGPRIFYISIIKMDTRDVAIGVYDFSAYISAWGIKEVTGEDGRVLRVMLQSSPMYDLPWNGYAICLSGGGHDSIVLMRRGGRMHVWSF